MIKINDIKKAQDLNTSSKAKKTTGGENFSAYLQQTMNHGKNPVSGVGNIAVTDAVFAAQLADGVEENAKRKKLIKRGHTLLDKLEEIRQALLLGYISTDRLIEISRFVKEQKTLADDNQINEIIAEIELRVEVELAKLTK